jgi:UDP-N-acetylmuramate dehydrogenase
MVDSDSKKWLADLLGSNVKFDEPMSAHTSFRVGGPADAFAAPENIETLAELIRGSRQRGIPYIVIGGGTNLLVKDKGIRGIVIVLKKCLNEMIRTDSGTDGVLVTVSAGANLQKMCRFAIKNGLAGMNFALGIPGTAGGGIRMNAGTARGSMEGVLDSVKVLLPTGQTKRFQRKELAFEYRELCWDGEEFPVILEGYFRLYPADPVKLKKEAEEILKARKEKQPAGVRSAGCFFKNPPCPPLQKGGENAFSQKSAGQLIDIAGFKGKQIRGAAVSPQHANFIVNRDRASAADILALTERIQEAVFEKFNIRLEPEVKIIGE